MRTRIAIALSGLLALASAPVTSQAGASDRAVDACVKAFVDTHIPKDRVVRLIKDKAPGLMDRFHRQRSYTFALTAQGTQSGKILAQARCAATRSGEVSVHPSSQRRRDKGQGVPCG